MGMDMDTLLGLLSGVTPSGSGYKALCPCHADTDGSLCIDRAENGGLLIHCMAGCRNDDIMAAIGHTLADLQIGTVGGVPEIAARVPYIAPDIDFRDTVYRRLLEGLPLSADHAEQLFRRGLLRTDLNRRKYASLTNETAAVVAESLGQEFGDPLGIIPGFVRGELSGKWCCTGAEGLLIPVRDPEERIQGFQIRTGQPGRKYTWLSSHANSVNTPVHFPANVFWANVTAVRLTEGPLKADVATVLDQTMPTIAIPGVSAFDALTDSLAGIPCKNILLAFDADARTNTAVAASLVKLKSHLEATGYKVLVELWDVKDGKGIDDVLLSGGKRRVVETWELPAAAPELDDGIELVRLGNVVEKSVDWIWPGWLARGAVHLLDGDPGLGKSTLVCELVGRFTTGRPLPNGVKVPPQSVVVLSAEDPLDSVWLPRCRAAGADLDKVYFFNSIKLGPGDVHMPSFPEDIETLEQVIRRTGAGLIVIDPLFSYISDRLDANRDQHAKLVMTDLVHLARRTDSAILVVRHLNKNSETSALYRGQASVGIVGTVRIAWMLAPDPDAESKGCRTLSQTKNNMVPAQRGYRFSLVSDKPYTPGTSPPAKVEWGGKLDQTADEILHRLAEVRGSSSHGPKNAAEALFFAMVLSRGPVAASSIIERATATLGYSVDQTRRARVRLGIRATKTPKGISWELPVTIADLKRGFNHVGESSASEG